MDFGDLMDLKRTGAMATAMIAFMAGLAGSAVHGWLANRNPGIVRAARFEVVRASGKVLSYWGPDANPQLPSSTPQGTLLMFFDEAGRARVVIGIPFRRSWARTKLEMTDSAREESSLVLRAVTIRYCRFAMASRGESC